MCHLPVELEVDDSACGGEGDEGCTDADGGGFDDGPVDDADVAEDEPGGADGGGGAFGGFPGHGQSVEDSSSSRVSVPPPNSGSFSAASCRSLRAAHTFRTTSRRFIQLPQRLA